MVGFMVGVEMAEDGFSVVTHIKIGNGAANGGAKGKVMVDEVIDLWSWA